MIRAIVAIDEKLGMADDHGIPWQGKIPSDVKQFREKTLHGTGMMGGGWYKEQEKPLPQRRNIVATNSTEPLRPGFEGTNDARKFLQDFKGDIWVGGGAALLESTLDLADELHLTLLEGDFGCTKFFPEYKDKFEMASAGDWITENGVTYRFEVWKKKH